MNRVWCRLLWAAVVFGGALSLGCPTSLYKSETTLNDDGSLDRAIYQPHDQTPDAARAAGLWKQTTYAPNPDTLKQMKFLGAIVDLPVRDFDSKETPYFAAWNRFKSSDQVPEYYVLKAPPKSGMADAKLVRGYTRTEYGPVVEHRWTETLTDVVKQDDMRKARDELADFFIAVAADAFEEAYGKDWDASALVKWARNEGKAWWAELTDALYVHGLTHKGPGSEELLGEGLKAICARHGLSLTTRADGKDDGMLGQWAAADFVLGLLTKHVRSKKDGKPLDPLTAMKWIEDLNKDAEPKEEGQQPGVFQSALKKVVDGKYGGKDAATDRTVNLLARVFGLHYPDTFLVPKSFEYTMTVPGEVVETNGVKVAANQVKWEFPTKAAYPQGYTMSVRSLAVNEDLRKQLFNDDTLKDVKSRQSFVYIMKWGPEGLRQAVAEAVKQKSLAPVEAYKKKAGPDEKEWLDRLQKAFKPQAEPN